MLHHIPPVFLGDIAVTVAIGNRDSLQREVEETRTCRRLRHAFDKISGKVQVLLRGLKAFQGLDATIEPDNGFKNR